jgi:anti-sigma regulatory factor (Ser/Thr protein kinase)
MDHRRQTATLSRDDREVARARQLVATTLYDWGVEVEVPVMEILVSELVTNALVHGDGAIGLQLAADDGRVRLEVTDDGGTPTAPHIVDHGDIGGWGLQLVDRLADRWGAEKSDHCTRVWTEMRACA